MAFNEIADEVTCNIRTIFSFSVVYRLAIDLESGIEIARIMSLFVRMPSGVLPQAGLVETEVLGGISLLAQLPFAGYAGCVAALLQQMSKRCLVPVQDPEPHVITHVVDARHDLHA